MRRKQRVSDESRKGWQRHAARCAGGGAGAHAHTASAGLTTCIGRGVRNDCVISRAQQRLQTIQAVCSRSFCCSCASSWSPVGGAFPRAQVVASDLDFLSAPQASPALPQGAPVLALGHASAGGTATEFFGWTGAAWVPAAPSHTPGMAQSYDFFSLKHRAADGAGGDGSARYYLGLRIVGEALASVLRGMKRLVKKEECSAGTGLRFASSPPVPPPVVHKLVHQLAQHRLQGLGWHHLVAGLQQGKEGRRMGGSAAPQQHHSAGYRGQRSAEEQRCCCCWSSCGQAHPPAPAPPG